MSGMKRAAIGFLAVLAISAVMVGSAATGPEGRLEAATQAATCVRGGGSQYDLCSRAPTRTVAGRLIARVPNSVNALYDKGLSGTVTLSLYAGGRWATLATARTDTSGSFRFTLTRRGQHRIAYVGTASTRPVSAVFDVYMDDLKAAAPALVLSYDDAGNAFVVFRTDVAAPDTGAYASATGDNGVLQFMLTPVTNAVASYNGPYAECTQVVIRNGTYAWGTTVPKAQLAAGTQWRVVTFFQVGEYYRPSVRNDTFTVPPAPAR